MQTRPHKVLVVEDEEKILSVIKSFLESKGFIILSAEDGKKGLEYFKKEKPDIILLDLMLPEISGEEVCRRIRLTSKVPIIMLTAKSDETDMLMGLGMGADDYITKPFSLKNLYARMEAVLRRTYGHMRMEPLDLEKYHNELRIDIDSHRVTRGGIEVKLTPNEYKLLRALMKYPNKVFTREELILTALGEGYDGFDRTIDSHIKNLRHKIELDPKNPLYIKTIHGVGYKFEG